MRAVVEKGAFRKVTAIDVVAGTVAPLDPEITTLPSIHSPPESFTPHIALALGTYDSMDDILAKIGLCPINILYRWTHEACDHVDVYVNGGDPGGWILPPFGDLLRDLDLMRQYHIIFIPCSNSDTDAALSDPAVLSNIRDYVMAGGKLFVGDWSYDFIERALPDFIDFEGDDSVVGSADSLSSAFDTRGRALDFGLREWLAAIAEPADGVSIGVNWDCIEGLGTVPGFDEHGNPISITPIPWVAGPITRSHACMSGNAPLTVIFPNACGRILYTTSHSMGMESFGNPDLTSQERILLYLILEMLSCR